MTFQLNARTIVKWGGTVTGTVKPLSGKARVDNAVMRALENGYLGFRYGETAARYEMFLRAYDMPGVVVSDKGGGWYYKQCHFYNQPAAIEPIVKEWWKLDRIDHRIADPESWARMEKLAKDNKTYYGDLVYEPNWDRVFHKGLARRKDFAVRMLSQNTTQLIGDKLKPITESPEYQAKLETIKALLKANQKMAVEVLV